MLGGCEEARADSTDVRQARSRKSRHTALKRRCDRFVRSESELPMQTQLGLYRQPAYRA